MGACVSQCRFLTPADFHLHICFKINKEPSESERKQKIIMDISDFSQFMKEQSLSMFTIDGWSLIQRTTFDIQVGEDPYHSVQIFVNLKSSKYSVRVWGKSVRRGTLDTAEDLEDLCNYFFSHSAACAGYIGPHPGDDMDLVEVSHPFTRWVSRSCYLLYELEHPNLMVGMCTACSADAEKITIKEELPNCDVGIQDGEIGEDFGNEIDDSHESVQMPTNDSKSPSPKSPMSVMGSPHSPEGGSNKGNRRVKREKPFSPADRELARSLLRQFDTGVFGCGKWAFGVKDEKEKVVDAIYCSFRLQCSEQRRSSVTKGQLQKLLYVVRRQDSRLHAKAQDLEASTSRSSTPSAPKKVSHPLILKGLKRKKEEFQRIMDSSHQGSMP